MALVTIAAKTTLEQLIPQVDQWSFQKLFRSALLLASAVRDCRRIHPNLQPNNILVFDDSHFTIIDQWPSIPSSCTYGRYPYIAPEIFHQEGCHRSDKSIVYALGIMLWQLASGVIFPQSLSITPSIYDIDPLPFIDPAYQDIIVQCLQRDPQKRPSAQHVCDGLVRILMTEMACPSRSHQEYIQAIQNRQSIILKHLIAQNASKQDIQNVMYGASITRRMRVHVALSFLDPIFHWQAKEKKSNPPRRLSISSTEEDDDSYYIVQSRKKKVHYVDNCSTLYGADLPELMQMGFT